MKKRCGVRHSLVAAVATAGLWLGGLTASVSAQDVELNVIERTLKNGMKVLMVERHDAPTVALYLLVKVGGVDDPQGKTGIAHILEHMMFKGTTTYGTLNYKAELPLMAQIDQVYGELDRERRKGRFGIEKPDEEKIQKLEEQLASLQQEQKKYVVSEELWQTYERLGAVGLNASTGNDSTQYFVQMPSNQLEVWAYLEADRLANPVFREYYSERDVVHEERRARTDTQPRGLLWENFQAGAFHAHPYRNPIIGWPADIDSLMREEVQQYFKIFYAPNNCIVAIVGDIDPEQTMRIVEKYFGPIPAQPQPRRNISEEPPQRGERRVRVVMEAQPQLLAGYHIPRTGHEDTFALDVTGLLLSGVTAQSRTGRLYQALVLDKKVALEADAGANTSLYPNLFLVSVTPAQGKTTQEVEAAIYEEIRRLQREPPSEEEMTRVRNGLDASLLRALRTNFGVARMIASAEHLAGTWRYILTEREKLKAVTPADVQRVAREYFAEENRTVGELRAKEAEEDSSPEPPPSPEQGSEEPGSEEPGPEEGAQP